MVKGTPSNKKAPLTYISLFSSAGIGCYGFKLEGFECIATVELIERRLNIQKHNNKCRYENGYIAADILKTETKEKIKEEVAFWQNKHRVKDVDVLLSTPPCQGMSVANHKKKNETQRNSLVVESISLTKEIRPKVFVFENVRSFLTTPCSDIDGTTKKIREAIELNLGGTYNIHYQVINFKDYGNPSSRTRTLVIGVRKDIQEVTPLDLMPTLKPARSLREVIGDLPSLKEMGQIDPDDIYHQFRSYAPHMRVWIQNTKEGQSSFDNSDPEKRPHQIVDGKKILNENKNGDKYTRAFWDRPGACVHTRNDILASQVTIHPKDDRVFSIRELMKLMSIPENFKWTDVSFEKLNRLSKDEKVKALKTTEINIRQSIGEAVPTIIFQQIARNLRKIVERPGLSETEIRQLIHKKGLTDPKKLKTYIILNLRNYRYWELAKIVEFSNAERDKLAAYYTRQDICFTIVKDLPDASQYETLKIIEPSVGAGNFLPLLIEKYKTVRGVEIDVVDIDQNSLQILRQLTKKLAVPKNITINFIHADFLTHGDTNLFGVSATYDIAVGNPPFGAVKNQQLLAEYRKNKFNKQTSNLFSFFLEKCLQTAAVTGLVIPKAFLSAPEFNLTRELVSNFAVKKINDYGEKAFKGVKIETLSIIVDARQSGSSTIIESYIKNEITIKKQPYICSPEFPYWLVYRNDFFDGIARKLHFNIFSAFRDRQITKKHTKNVGSIRVLKSRNIGDNSILDIPQYDTYIDDTAAFAVAKFLNKPGILIPNLTYYPRACFLPKNTLVDGSVAILTPKNSAAIITKTDLAYYGSEEFEKFYRVARNFGTRSLNIDSNSVFFLGIKKIDVEQASPPPSRT